MKAIVPTLALVIGLLEASVFAADTKAKTGTVWGVVALASGGNRRFPKGHERGCSHPSGSRY
jgi:hypothetical protein